MKSKNLQKIGGWHRLWIFISIVYFLLVLSISVFFYYSDIDTFKNDLYLKYMEAVYHYKFNTNIRNLLTELKNALISKKYIDNSLVGQFILSVKKQSDSIYVTIKSNNKFYLVLNKDKITIEYPKSTKIDDICSSLEELLTDSTKTPDFEKLRYEYYSDMTPLQIVKKCKEQYGNEIDFYKIDKSIEGNIKNFRIKTFGVAFLVWIVPVLLLYILGVSIGWIIRGFKNKT